MDAGEYWQENKRFVTTVGVGLLAFLIGVVLIDSLYAADLEDAQRSRSELIRKRGQPRFSRAERADAERENEELLAALGTLREAVEFEVRPRYRRDPAQGSASSQYLRVAADVRDELLPLANRSRMALVGTLGLPELSPTGEDEIVRYLEALDLIDRVVRMAVATGVARVDQIRISLDPAVYKRGEPVAVERTRVEFQMNGPSLPLLRFLERSQDPEAGGPLAVLELELSSSSTQTDEARLDLTLVVPRIHDRDADDTGEVN